MAISLVGKIVITVVSLGVIAGMAVTITFLVRDSGDGDETTVAPDTTTPSTTTDGEGETPTSSTTASPDTEFLQVGVGIADMTGPCVEINFMGYADLSQSGAGIHMRQYSRAFIFWKGTNRVVLVTAEVQAIGLAVGRQVVENLQELYGDMYNINNVILTATHTHSAPGGHLGDFLLDVSILGFSRETFNAYVAGITRSIVRAHENMEQAQLFFGQTRITNAHINRSPYSYDYNPPAERSRYESDTDETLTQVRIVKTNGDLHGVLNWFAIHTTSMNMTNQLISSDNLGYASMLMEKMLNPGLPTGKPDIVAGFFSANLGDVSPNIEGARCEFSEEVCDNQFLLCDANERCYSIGPGNDMFESTRIIGNAVYEGAVEVLNSPGVELTGDIKVVHQFVNVPEEVVSRYNTLTGSFNANEQVRGCSPALGYSFGAGTIDGANTLDLTQGMLAGLPQFEEIINIISTPTEEDIDCHAPKPILLATGRVDMPYAWHPRIVSASVIWLGDLAIAGVPGEPTTMAGRRIRDVIGNIMESNGFQPRVVVSGLTNEYIHYLSTYEEYQVQRYEAASTIYGPHTLDIFLNKFSELTTALIQDTAVPAGPEPADTRENTLSLITPVLSDLPPEGANFGDVLEQPEATVQRGQSVSATFIAANPRNDLRQEESHATVERSDGGNWVVVATDADWETIFSWERVSVLFATSNAKFEWNVPEDAPAGTYRMVYYGASRRLIGTITPFTATSNSFVIS